jgi:hypothetical protein
LLAVVMMLAFGRIDLLEERCCARVGAFDGRAHLRLEGLVLRLERLPLGLGRRGIRTAERLELLVEGFLLRLEGRIGREDLVLVLLEFGPLGLAQDAGAEVVMVMMPTAAGLAAGAGARCGCVSCGRSRSRLGESGRALSTPSAAAVKAARLREMCLFILSMTRSAAGGNIKKLQAAFRGKTAMLGA